MSKAYTYKKGVELSHKKDMERLEYLCNNIDHNKTVIQSAEIVKMLCKGRKKKDGEG